MTKLIKAGLSGLAMLWAGAGAAADLRSVALPPAPALPSFYSWTGVYAGVQGGYSWGSNRVRIGAPTGPYAPMSFRVDDDSAFGGAHAGFNYQMGSVVLGLEGDIEAVNSRSRFDGVALAGRVSQDWQGAARGRLGYAFDRLMVYAAGGASFTEYERRLFSTGGGFGERLTSARTGWNLGAGVNFAFTDHLILGAEYRYTDFGRNRFASSGPFPGLTGDQELTTHSARASVAYKF
ncbi:MULTISPECIES: outer membrane protein [unclassified Bosea (in: a-proteobacteria)]|uniref:outer membrane protein n=1 Tax=unclassified Bosea (in: a-proteobacteria) TaxID=2653178 RepID=UPI000955AF7E|nr:MULTISPECIES: outer membrane protein [unclassified Bosea (in: a-proteobacteria)]TAJ31204.1 MAG: porin family protein [Bosea sp. (in: a-proteobacteria)]SIQ95008.1 outer membrane immunogenic protein [Bosea sp. TND4EK4]